MIDSGRRSGTDDAQVQVSEATRLRPRRGLRRVHAQDVLIAGMRRVREDSRLLEDDGAAARGRAHHFGPVAAAMCR